MMEQLSDELYFGVLAFVPPSDLLCSANRVSKRWAALISGDAFWRNHPLVDNGVVGTLASPPTPPPTPLSSLSLSCRTTQSFSTSGKSGSTPQLRLNTHQLQRICLYKAVATLTTVAWKHGTMKSSSPSRPTSVLPRLSEAIDVDYVSSSQRRCCTASTTDHRVEQLINVLRRNRRRNTKHLIGVPGLEHLYSHRGDDDDDVVMEDDVNYGTANRIWGRDSWWSSRSTPLPDSTETLLFVTRCPLVLLTRLYIRPLTDPHNCGVCYTWKQTVVRAYRLPLEQLADPNRSGEMAGFPCSFPIVRNHDSDAFARDQATIEATLHGYVPVFESEPFAIPLDCSDFYEFSFPMTTTKTGNDHGKFAGDGGVGGVVANLITIDLIGKNNEQFHGRGYYAAVETVDAHGIPLLEDPRQEVLLCT